MIRNADEDRRFARTLLCATIGITVALVFGASIALAQSRASSGTAVKIYAPFDASGHIVAGLRVRTRATGYCWVGSLVAYRRADAWRCFIGNEIHDPCFSSGFANGYVICSARPWSSDATRIELTKTLPTGNKAGDPLRGAPWALKLVSGSTCSFVQGATGFMGGKRLNYACSNGLALYGEPRRVRPTWKIFANRRPSHALTLVAISVAWW